MYALQCHRRRIRHTVWPMLAVWLFALATGVVNACILTPQGAGSSGLAATWHPEAAQHEAQAGTGSDAGHHGHRGPVDQPDHEFDAGKDGCLKFCDDESSALSKSMGSALDAGVPLLASIAPAHPIVANTTLDGWQSREWPAAQGPPLVIRFLRLNL